MDVQVTEVSMDVGSDGKLALVKVGEEPTAKKTKRSHKGKKKEKKEKEKDKEKDKEKGKEKKHKKHKDSKKKHKGGKKKHKDQEPESGTDHTQKRRDLSTQAASMFAPGTPEYYAEDPSRRERAEALFKETEADMQDKSGIVNVRLVDAEGDTITEFTLGFGIDAKVSDLRSRFLWYIVHPDSKPPLEHYSQAAAAVYRRDDKQGKELEDTDKLFELSPTSKKRKREGVLANIYAVLSTS